MTILSTVISFLMGGVPKIMDMFQDRSDKKHELELARMQTERDMQMMKEGYAAQARVEEIRTEQVAINAEAQTHMRSEEHHV